jgi:hypothetical protein
MNLSHHSRLPHPFSEPKFITSTQTTKSVYATPTVNNKNQTTNMIHIANFGLRYYAIIWHNFLKPFSLSTVTSVARVRTPLLERPGGGKVIIKPFLKQTFISKSVI